MQSLLKAFAAALTAVVLAAIPACSSKSNNSMPTAPAGSNAFDSGNLAGSAHYAHVFDTEGTFGYHCAIHPEMRAAVKVSAAGAANVAVSIVNMVTGFSPDTVTIAKGGTVNWTNNDVATHTVTSN